MKPERQYEILQALASPVTAITARHGDQTNGMISNSAIRASLLPNHPRVSFYCFQKHLTHELIENSGWFGLHLVGRDQFDLVRQLGFRSGRDTDKLSDVPHHDSPNHELPLLEEPPVAMECEVVNAMNAGPSTFFLGEIHEFETTVESIERNNLMSSDHWRTNMPEEWREEYEQNKQKVQKWARENVEVDRSYRWHRPGDSGDASSPRW